MLKREKSDYLKWVIPIATLLLQAGGLLAMNDNFRERLKTLEQAVLNAQIKLSEHDTIVGVIQAEIERLRGKR